MSTNSDIVLLLCAPIKGAAGAPRALSPREYAAVAHWLAGREMQPQDLLESRVVDELAAAPPLPALKRDRLHALLGRGMALGLARQQWGDAGLFVLTRADPGYPKALRRLVAKTPPVLFGYGNVSLSAQPGLGVVGSRNAQDDDLMTAGELGRFAAAQGVPLVSGGARGIDSAAMGGALEAGGTGVALLSHDLARAIRRRDYRAPLSEDRLLLLSPYSPFSGFNVGQAMGRNKLIYALSAATVAVTSAHGSGGTWAGATEALKTGRVPVYVPHAGEDGLRALVELGAHVLPDFWREMELGELADVPRPTLPGTPASPPVERDRTSGESKQDENQNDGDNDSLTLIRHHFPDAPFSRREAGAVLGLSTSATAKRLGALVEAGKLSGEKSGRAWSYRLADALADTPATSTSPEAKDGAEAKEAPESQFSLGL